MEEVLAQFQSTAINPENDQTSFDGLYKNWGRFGQQEKRRKDILDNQKKNRNVKMDTSRGIIDIVSSIEKGNNDRYRPSIYVAGFTKTSLTYENVLMHSEWLIEKPEDFETNWVVVPCPKGVRTLVVAHQGNTRCYTKHGYFRLGCHTALPCGNPQDSYNSSQCVVLDCFYVELINKMYVLDVLAWKSQPMTDGETEFRHYWLKSQIEEIPELKTVNDKNKIIFELLPKVSCKPDSFNEFMMKVPHFENFTPQLDGLLFYHQKANYISGETPLVGWLFPYMVNEVLGPEITVHPAYLKEKPTDYVNQAQFIRNFDYNIKKRQPARRKKAVKIEECNEMEQSEINEIVQSEPNANSETAEGFLMDSDKDVEWKSEMSTNNGHFTSMTPVDGS